MNTAQRVASTAKRRWAADPHATARLLGVQQQFTPNEQLELTLPVRIAFERVRTGAAANGDFDTLACAANIAVICVERKHALAELACKRAQAALMRMRHRHTALGRWGLDGPGLQEVADMLDVYDQLSALLSPAELTAACEELQARMLAGEVLQ